LIKKAEAIGDAAFSEILPYIKPGTTELEVAARLEFIMKMKGVQNLSFPSIVASGINSSMPHAVPSQKKIETGDFVTLDFGCTCEGYCSDMTRTVVVGKASDKHKEVYQLVLEAQMAALDFIKAGYQGKEIDKVARDIIYKAGYEGCFGHGLGHSVGLNVHENPRLSPMEEEIIQEGMTETVEPGIYIKGFGGVRIEDLVVVTGTGCENFTHSPKNLIEL
jgi:Xaa-Pro aminopeptidase